MAILKRYEDVCNDANQHILLEVRVKTRKKIIKAEGYESTYFNEVPDGKTDLYARHHECNWGRIASIKKNKGLTVNFWGTVVLNTADIPDFKDKDELDVVCHYIDAYTGDHLAP